ncbi:murein L,D-transpeptidase catalytic domain family protein [Novosphingobium sp. JCM 18896]|uniref:murein L,D-transpeptidase catalytic domain family protein n=1 Tax=Novosphingobium sp. JCM 18896 TaxID=2989731 RepID=UPI0022222831|nr:murein L,D-transpeptidase catalytic domain family protein [Novosphingobium sp. JCM 18896]MCW1430207.1 murein L,D-transpeptidase catalytic domain family protein [Novosphingobium sp. JCM 18896]
MSRRRLVALGGAAAATGAAALMQKSSAMFTAPRQTAERAVATKAVAARPIGALDPQLLRRALGALDRHSSAVRRRDRLAIVDFTAPSSERRLHLVDLAAGKSSGYLVAHGSGSDPDHTGFLQNFSNRIDSNASSEGAFVTADYYVGKHGRSQRLLGLDETNCNALTRSIVVHGAWYANADMIPAHGKLGRSQGCFAVGERELSRVFDFLGEERMIYAAKA